MNTQKNDAQQYAEQIAEELRQLDAAIEGDSESQAALFGEEVTEGTLTDLDILSEYLNRYALDLSVRRDTRGSDYGSTIEITRTMGGPGCWVRRDTEDGITIEVTASWGGDRGRVVLSLHTLATWLDELAAMP